MLAGLASHISQQVLRTDVAGMPLEWEGKAEKEVGRDKDGVVRVAVDPAYYRPAEVDLLIGDYAKAKRELGWEPQTKFANLVQIMTEADIKEVEKKGW